jgi:hypothetical protein
LKPKSFGEWLAPPESTDSAPKSTEPVKIDEDETRLYYQEFLMKPQTRVIDFLHEQGVKVDEFVRFECGEPL